MYACKIENPPPQKKRFSTPAIISAILGKLSAWGIRGGDRIDIIRLEYELSLAGITDMEFSHGLVELIDQRWVDFRLNDLRLSPAGYSALSQGTKP